MSTVNNNDPENQLVEVFRFNLFLQNLNKKAEVQYGITFVQWFLLKKIRENPAMTFQDLAKIAGVHPSTLTQNLKRLLKKELVFVSVEPRDGRKKIVSITRKGKDISEGMAPDLNEILSKWKDFQTKYLLN